MTEKEEAVKNKATPLISIVIPLYNEENSIAKVLKRIPTRLKHEIIIVDDCSSDNGVDAIKKLNMNNIRIITHDKNQGYGTSILDGFKAANGDIVVTIDSDGQHNPEEIPKLIKPIIKNEADVVVGSRYLGRSTYKVPLHTRIGEFGISFCLNLLYGQRVDNNQNGFRAFTHESLESFNDIISRRFGFCTEAVFKAAYNKLRIKEVPIIVNSREYGTSYVQLIGIMKPIFSLILLYALKKFKRLLERFASNATLDKMYLIITKPLRNF